MISFLLGIFIGSTLVGSSVQRTLSVGKGEVGVTLISAVMNSASYFFSVYFIADKNITAYLGTCVGSTAIVLYMSILNRRRRVRIQKDKR